MARKIETAMISAIRSKDVFRQANTAVSIYGHNDDNTPMIHKVYLHNNLIAEIDYTTRHVVLSSCGRHTTTTKSRINAVLTALGIPGGVYQAKGDWYLTNGNGNSEQFHDGIRRGF